MRESAFSDHLTKLLAKLSKKDRTRYHATLKKIEEILTCENIDHYKNLRAPLQHLKRVHIDSSFVLTFRFDKNDDTVYFYDLDHHDRIYRAP
ncbi:MAG: addiction module toxin RelE [Candidatus Woesearchaeota archaeon]